MKEKGVSKQEALSAFAEIIEDRWKHINAEWVKCDDVPKEMVVQFLNLARACEIIYKNTNVDGVPNPELVATLLVDPLLP